MRRRQAIISMVIINVLRVTTIYAHLNRTWRLTQMCVCVTRTWCGELQLLHAHDEEQLTLRPAYLDLALAKEVKTIFTNDICRNVCAYQQQCNMKKKQMERIWLLVKKNECVVCPSSSFQKGSSVFNAAFQTHVLNYVCEIAFWITHVKWIFTFWITYVRSWLNSKLK